MAGPLPPGPEFPEVDRVTVADAGFAAGSVEVKVTAAVALAVKTPGELLLMVTEQVATLPETEGEPQVVDCDVGAGVTTGVIDPKLTLVPVGMAVTVTLKVCWLCTSLTPLGAIATEAST